MLADWWSFEGYCLGVLGDDDARKALDRHGICGREYEIREWLERAEVTAWAATGRAEPLPDEWHGYRERATERLVKAWREKVVEAVRAHAKRHYSRGGWDYVVEAYDDAEILEDTEDAATLEDAIRMLGDVLATKDEHRKEAMAAADVERRAADLPPMWNRG